MGANVRGLEAEASFADGTSCGTKGLCHVGVFDVDDLFVGELGVDVGVWGG